MRQIPSRSAGPSARPEIELLLACARTSIDITRAEQIPNLLHQRLDWEYLIQSALQHKVVPLLYTSIQATCPAAVPSAALELLRDYYHASAQQTLFLTGELLKLLDRFTAQGILALPFKGPVLAVVAYGDLALRQAGDLDILIHERDVLRAKDIFIAQGYHTEQQLTEREEALHLRTHYVYTFVRDDGMATVELHYRIRPQYFSFALDFEHLWARRESVLLGGRMLRSFAPDDLLLALCAHGANHWWQRLSWICDIAELLRLYAGMDWAALLERARALGSERMLLLGVVVANDLLGAALPEEIQRRVQADPVVVSLAGQVGAGLFQESARSSGLFAGALFHLKARERLRDKLRYCLRVALITTAEDWALLPLPARLSFIYSLLRPFRLAGTYGLSRLNDLPRLLKRWLVRSARMMLHNRPW